MVSLPILTSLPEGGSGTGISHYSTAISCSRKLNLDKQLRQSLGPAAEDNFRLNVGKIFHALCEIYFTGGNSHIAIELNDVNYGEAPDEARRLFEAYAKRFAPTDFARVVGCEVQLPPDEQSARIVEEAVGVSPFTCRLDMVVEVDAASAETLYEKRRLILETGYYAWDFKTKAQKSATAELEYRHSPQFISYQLAWNALHPERPLKGMVADIIVAHKNLKDESFASILVPAPTETQAAGLRRFLANAKRATETDEPNWLACFGYGRACSHLLSGACTRA